MRYVFLLSLPLIVTACSSGPTDPGAISAAELQNAVSRLSVAITGVAAGREGRSFLDNFLPCPRRGVIDYSNVDNGRRVSFSGCDLGADVVVEGSGFIEWIDARQPRNRFCEFAAPPGCARSARWSGELTVETRDGSMALSTLELANISTSVDGAFFPAFTRIDTGGLGFVSLDAILNGETIPVADTTLPGDIFNSKAAISSPIPNPGGSLGALTEADIKRIAYNVAVELAGFLINETTETQRGDHTHDLECGTSQVTVDLTTRLPDIRNAWTGCDVGGISVSGNFLLRWGNLAQTSLQMSITGNVNLRGGLPETDLVEIDWKIALSPGFPSATGMSTISGSIANPADRTRFAFEIFLDD